MARAPNPKALKAKRLYQKNMALVDIAKKLDVPASTVRRWKSDYDWEGKKKQSERSDKSKPNARKRGGQFGNKNAKGPNKEKGVKGGPPQNQKAVIHGAYASVFWDVLSDEEKQMIEDIPIDEDEMLIEEIQLCTVRERRLMQRINDLREKKGGQMIYGVTKFESRKEFKDKEEEDLYNHIRKKKIEEETISYIGRDYTLTTNTGTVEGYLQKLEEQLTKVQQAKTKAIDSLAKLRMERMKLDKEEENAAVVDAWISAVLDKDIEGADEDEQQ